MYGIWICIGNLPYLYKHSHLYFSHISLIITPIFFYAYIVTNKINIIRLRLFWCCIRLHYYRLLSNVGMIHTAVLEIAAPTWWFLRPYFHIESESKYNCPWSDMFCNTNTITFFIQTTASQHVGGKGKQRGSLAVQEELAESLSY